MGVGDVLVLRLDDGGEICDSPPSSFMFSGFIPCSGILSYAKSTAFTWGLTCLALVTTNPGYGQSPPIDPTLGAPLTVRSRPTLGSETADVVVIEVRSFKCAQCRSFHERVFPSLREKFIVPGVIRWVRIDGTPDKADANAAVFAIARCATHQNAYNAVESFLFRNGSRPSSFLYGQVENQPGVDRDALAACLRREGGLADVRADFAEISALKVTVLPTFILRKRRANGEFAETRIEGYPQADYFERILAQLRAHP